MSFTLGSLSGVNVQTYSGFNFPPTAQSIVLLGDGSGSGFETIQQGSLPLRRAAISGTLDYADTGTVRGYFETLESVSFTDDDGNTLDVRVLEFTSAAVMPDVWDYSATLIEAG